MGDPVTHSTCSHTAQPLLEEKTASPAPGDIPVTGPTHCRVGHHRRAPGVTCFAGSAQLWPARDPTAPGTCSPTSHVPLNSHGGLMSCRHMGVHRFPGLGNACIEVKTCLDNGKEPLPRREARNLMVTTPLCGCCPALPAPTAKAVSLLPSTSVQDRKADGAQRRASLSPSGQRIRRSFSRVREMLPSPPLC